MGVDASRLEHVPLFAALTADDRAALAEKMEERHAGPGEHLSNQGGSGYFFFVIEAGAAEVSRDGQVVAKLGPADFFGEIAILSTPRRTATVTAISPMTLLAMFGADFAKFAAEMPDLAAQVQHAIEERS
jgi:CRP/FNR family transcriptional regulator, cyclic AMP receptor protein